MAAPVRDREARLEQLLHAGAPTARTLRGGVEIRVAGRIDEILKESARYNIGSITRNINTPVMSSRSRCAGASGSIPRAAQC